MLSFSLVVFVVIRVIPGDAATLILGIQADDSSLEQLRTELGLNKPFINQYAQWLYNIIHLDFGHSRLHGVSVKQLIKERLEVSIPLAFLSFVTMCIIAFSLTLLATLYKNIASCINVYNFSIIALPNFILAFVFIYYFGLYYMILPAGGYPDQEASLYIKLTHLILPSLTLSITQAAITTRIWQASLHKNMQSNYVLLARAKGLNTRQVILRHALRSSLNPVLGILGLQTAFLLSGIIIIENIFALPGIGTLLVKSVYSRDLDILQNLIMLFILTVLFINLIVDLINVRIDPRNQAFEDR